MTADLFYRKPRLTVVAVGLILAAGFTALEALPRQEDPTISRRFAVVTTFYPGASALRVESLVTEKIESRLRELHEIKQIESVSRSGVSIIQIELGDPYDDEQVDEIWSKARDKVSDAVNELPAAASRPELADRTATAATLVVGLSWVQDEEPQYSVLGRLAAEIENRLRNVPGTRETDVYGAPVEEILVVFDPAELAGVGLTARDVSRAIADADAKVPAGQLRGSRNVLFLEVEGELDSVARIRQIPLRQGPDGSMLRVGDIATVERGIHKPQQEEAWLSGRPGVAVGATMEAARRVDRWADSARRVVEDFRREVPDGIRFQILFEQNDYTEARLASLVGNLLLGATILILVLLFMMGLRSALIVSSALPLTVAAVLAEMNLLGIPLHQMSITGLIIALGLLIDNAIVVVDEYNLERERGAGSSEAVARTAGHLVVPLAASTLTTVLAFLPIALMPGAAGEFVGPIAIGVGLAVATSFFVSVTLVLAFAGRFGAERPPGVDCPWWQGGYRNLRLQSGFRRFVTFCLRRPAFGIGISLVLPLAGFAAGRTLSEQFFPPNDRNQFQVQFHLPPQASIAETRSTAFRARELIHGHDAVLESHWFLGRSAPRVFYNMFGVEEGISSYGAGIVTTASADATEKLLPRLQSELMDALPDAQMIVAPFEQGPPFDAPIEVRLIGSDLDLLRSRGEEVRALLSETTGVTFAKAKLQGGEPKLLLETDEDEARIAGVGLVEIAAQLDARFEGVLGGTVLEANQNIPVRVRVADDSRSSTAEILSGRALPQRQAGAAPMDSLPSASIAGAPLSALARLHLVPELAGVPRRNGERTNTVQAYLVPYTLIADSLAEFQRRLEESPVDLPPGYRLEIGGESELRGEALSNLVAFAAPLFFLMAGAIVLTFDSFLLALIVFSVAVLSVGLATLAVWASGYPMGFITIVGTMGLVGLAINDSIVVLSALVRSEGSLDPDLDRIVDVVLDASRHIFATTLTTIAGFVPLILSGGRFWPPMATAIAGGVGGATILALLFVPTVYLRIQRRRAPRVDRAQTERGAALDLVAPAR